MEQRGGMGGDNLHKWQEVIVQGHLTQRLSVDGRTFVEITAEGVLEGKKQAGCAAVRAGCRAG